MNNIPVSTTQQTNNNPIINTAKSPQNIPNTTAVSVDSSTLQEGHIISAEVIDHSRHEVTVLLKNNQTITAPLSDDSLVKIGETYSFRILKGENDQLLLQAFNANTSPLTSTILEALEAANLPKSERNQEIVRELLKQHMSIDKQTIQDILRHSVAFKDASISSLILMNKHHFPISEENVTQFENYRNYEHRIIKEIEQITESLPELMTKIGYQADSNESVLLLGKILHTISSGETPIIPNQELAYFSLSEQDNKELLLFLKNYPSEKERFSELLESKGNPKELIASLKEQGIQHPVITHMEEQYQDYQMEQRQIGAFLPIEDRANLLTDIQNSSPASNMPPEIQDGTITTHDMLLFLENQFTLSDREHNLNPFTSNQYKAILKEHLIHKWTLTPKDLTQKNAVSNLYNKMYENLSEINDFISQLKFHQQATQENQPLRQFEQDITNTRQNIDFMKTLNELFTYVQLPLQLKNKTVHSDLYVYTNKKELKKNKDQVSALLHLDLDYLGSLDIHINLNYKQVTSKFYLENNELQEFLSEHLEELGSILESKGYIFHGEVHQKERDSNIIENFLETSSQASLIQKYSFDIRA